MTLQNRVDPFGTLHANPARGTLMGNRGILHDDNKTILKTHEKPHWVSCTLVWKDKTQTLMKPGHYTQLFFLDEATSFAAGHRPCAHCRRKRYREFTDAWRRAHGEPEDGRSLRDTIDKALHATRIDRKKQKVTFEAPVESLPDGTMFLAGDDVMLVWQGRHLLWGFDGYQDRASHVSGDVTVLTPQPVVEVFKNGFTPSVHASAD